jgi:hypothetical protein
MLRDAKAQVAKEQRLKRMATEHQWGKPGFIGVVSLALATEQPRRTEVSVRQLGAAPGAPAPEKTEELTTTDEDLDYVTRAP